MQFEWDVCAEDIAAERAYFEREQGTSLHDALDESAKASNGAYIGAKSYQITIELAMNGDYILNGRTYALTFDLYRTLEEWGFSPHCEWHPIILGQ